MSARRVRGLRDVRGALRAGPRSRLDLLGELARIDGESLTALVGLSGLMADLDRTLELDPDHAEALASKGIMLIRLPRLFGGDAAKGEAMLRRVLVLDPEAVSTRLVLAERCEGRGQREARRKAVGRVQEPRDHDKHHHQKERHHRQVPQHTWRSP